jgi:arylsulfatase A-like enzyme
MRLCFTTILVTAFAAGFGHAASPPNIIVIMADDLGYGDVSCNGATRLSTPYIDRLAADGLRFTSGYCSASTCTPTRYSFLTGTYAFRGKRTGIAPPNAPAIIKPGTETIASLLQRGGYKTAVIGKWHLGLGRQPGPDWNGDLKPGPLEIGFDTCLLLPTTNDRVPQVYVKDHRVLNLDPDDPLWVGDKAPEGEPTGKTHRDTLRMDWDIGHNGTIHNGISRIGFYTGGQAARFRDEDLSDKWVDESIKFIEANQQQPFFLFFASHAIHVPRMPHERFQGTTPMGYRGDAISELDWCVRRLTETLERLGLDDNTLVVFCSDNGPVLNDGYKDGAVEKLGDHKPAGPLSGGKYSIREGGTRTPFITWWPGRIKPGESDKIVCTIDLAASMAALAHVEVPEGAIPDSQNILPALLGEEDATGREELVQQDNGGSGKLGFRSGKWKLHRLPIAKNQRRTGGPDFNYELYDLETDLAEQHNMATGNPEVVEQLSQRLEEIVEQPSPREADTQ